MFRDATLPGAFLARPGSQKLMESHLMCSDDPLREGVGSLTSVAQCHLPNDAALSARPLMHLKTFRYMSDRLTIKVTSLWCRNVSL